MLMGTCHCGAARWEMDGDPGPATACNCTMCRRTGALWVYDHENERIRVFGPTQAYTRADKADPMLQVLFCATCSNVVAWRGKPYPDGRRRMPVNVRLAPPEAVADLPIEHFDGLTTFDDLGQDGKCVRDMWF